MQGNHAAARHDCDRALSLSPRYAKALHRRAKACETLGELKQALRDITAVCILEGFQNQATLMMADRVLKETESPQAAIRRAFLLSLSRAPTESELAACMVHWQTASKEEAGKSYERKQFPTKIQRTVMAEKTGKPYDFIEHLHAVFKFKFLI